MKNKTSYLLMYTAFFIYSLSGIFSKLASAQEFLSARYVLCFAGILLCMALYAVLWQQVLKGIPLSVAMSSKPLLLVLSLVWAAVLFKERIAVKTLAGVALIFAGIFVIGRERR